jgi:D-arabinose 1-dehydrogenase-like Zn-dependent alcohol dehydrogenase
LRTVAPLVGDPKKLVSVGDQTVSELGGETVRRHLGRADMERAAALMVQGRLDPHIAKSYPLYQAAEALAVVENGHALGKVVIDMTLTSRTAPGN